MSLISQKGFKFFSVFAFASLVSRLMIDCGRPSNFDHCRNHPFGFGFDLLDLIDKQVLCSIKHITFMYQTSST